MDLITAQKEVTMTSLTFRDLVNSARREYGEPEVENSHFLKRVEDELDGELGKRKVFVNPDGGRPSAYYDLTIDQCLLVGMRESKSVRRSVLAQLKELQAAQQPKLPQTFAEALQLAADQAKQLEQAKPKVQHYDAVVEREGLLNATQVAQKLGMSAIALNKHLESFDVYSKVVKRSRTFKQWFIDKELGEVKQVGDGYTQPLFTLKGEAWIIEKLISEGVYTPEIKG